jgi:hypothetical protein
VTRSTFSVAEARDLFDAAPFPWWVAGGRGLDLFAGRELRPHEDLDVAVLRRDERLVRDHVSGWDLQVAVGTERWAPWTRALGASEYAVWVRPDPGAPWAFELLFNDVDGSDWLFRRDHAIRLPLDAIGGRSADGTPYLVPELILLYKAKRARTRDEEDLEAVGRLLDDRARGWLADAIAHVHPRHRWIDRLTGASFT